MAITITYGEVAENHVGMQKVGQICQRGLRSEDLLNYQQLFQKAGYPCEFVDLTMALGIPIEQEASLLIVRNGVSYFGVQTGQFYKEQEELDHDKRALFRGQVKNKRARYNLCFDAMHQEPDYAKGKGRIVDFLSVPCLDTVRQGLQKLMPFSVDLKAEGNYYYDPVNCGISYHGDMERKIVIAVRLGFNNPLVFSWFHQWKPVGNPVNVVLNHGDIYFMSEKATGYDWKSPSKLTLRHAAGSSKYTKLVLPKGKF